MAREMIEQIAPHAVLYRDPDTGIAWVENGSLGIAHSPHPNIDASGSVEGMKERGYWRKDAQTVRSHGYVYNISATVIEDEYDRVAADHCRCGGTH